jgi:hypothetical protein
MAVYFDKHINKITGSNEPIIFKGHLNKFMEKAPKKLTVVQLAHNFPAIFVAP